MTLAEIKVGQDAVLRTIGGQGELRHHLLDMGLTPGTEVTLRKVAPMGDPIEVELRGYELTLRLADAAKIEVDNVHETDRCITGIQICDSLLHIGVDLLAGNGGGDDILLKACGRTVADKVVIQVTVGIVRKMAACDLFAHKVFTANGGKQCQQKC